MNPVFQQMRKQMLIDIVGQRGSSGDASFVYEIKPPKGVAALQDAMEKTSYVGPCPVPFADYVESVLAQTVKKLTVTRRSIRKAFEDLVISESAFNEIGPAINSASSIFFFGYPGNGKTSIAERITRLIGDAIYIPHAIEANGQIVKLYDPIQHTAKSEEGGPDDAFEGLLKRGSEYDRRFIRIKRPTIVVGGELIMAMLDLKYNPVGKYYEAPLQMKANGGIFMIDDFGRQQVRAMDLLNRWIVPLEKKYDYLTTNAGTKIEVPFDEILIFSTNLDPTQLADEAFLRRIKFKIEVRDPDEAQYRTIWELVCKGKRVDFDPSGVDYLIEKWYRPKNRPFRMCQPRDILDQMMSIAKYNMERVNFSPDLIDAACATYFISAEQKNFGVKVQMQ
jgi:predicted ATPase with chaperone activity